MCQRSAELSCFNRSWDAYESPSPGCNGPQSLQPLPKTGDGEGLGIFRLPCAGQMYLTEVTEQVR